MTSSEKIKMLNKYNFSSDFRTKKRFDMGQTQTSVTFYYNKCRSVVFDEILLSKIIIP
jgi:hypothetical protein